MVTELSSGGLRVGVDGGEGLIRMMSGVGVAGLGAVVAGSEKLTGKVTVTGAALNVGIGVWIGAG
jgi:hypothetical protein